MEIPSRVITCSDCGKEHDVFKTFSSMMDRRKACVYWVWGESVFDFEKHTLCEKCLIEAIFQASLKSTVYKDNIG